MKTTTTEKATASPLALKITKAIWPDGIPQCSYCYDDIEEGEEVRQRDRDRLAVKIDAAMNPEHDLLNAVAEAAVNHLRDELKRRPGVPIYLMELQNAVIGLKNFREGGK